MGVFGRFRGQLDTADRMGKGREWEQSGLDHLRDGDLRMAKTDLRKAVGFSPNNPALRVHLSGVLARLGEFEDAEKELLIAIKLQPEDEALRFAHGQVLEEMHQDDAAVAAYALASRLNASSARSLTAISSVEFKRGNLEEAEQYVVQALDRDEKDPGIWSNLMRIRLALLVEEQGNIDRGITMLLSARDSAPSDPSIQRALGVKMARRGQLKQAIDLYRQLIASPPADLEFYREMELGQIRAEQGTPLPRPGSEAWIDLMQVWLGVNPASPAAAPQTADPVRASQSGSNGPAPMPSEESQVDAQELGTIWQDTGLLAATDPVAQTVHGAYVPRPVAPIKPAEPAAETVAWSSLVREEPSPSGRLTRPATIGAEESAPPARPMVPTALPSRSLPPAHDSKGAIGELEFEVARDPGNSKLRRDLSILYLQAGRLIEAKEQARKAEDLRSRRGTLPTR